MSEEDAGKTVGGTAVLQLKQRRRRKSTKRSAAAAEAFEEVR